ncbi:HNH endonuclease signature motif containing protein [Campylobacter jejuni]|uniref:HNH endonuclease signature motif containing protein n=1 Tax=Campylobacter jejuni TaxID=197 RepID=UPI001643435B|nr:HNH endonuclease signature motif containing protein [Campylobacter jejuni]
MKKQQYENYWQLTLEYSDFYGNNFNECLKIIIEFMDKNPQIDSQKYQELQEKVYAFNPKSDFASVRKSINQFFKLGFINNKFEGYHSKTKEFLHEQNRTKKKILYSEILYDNASFSRSFRHPSNENELKFLVKTIEYCGSITKENLLALMYVKDTIHKNYLNKQELEQLTHHIMQMHAAERKYNQIAYLWNICTNILTGIYLDQDNCLTLDRPDYSYTEKSANRDTYKQTLYKHLLYEESREFLSDVYCYVENLKYPLLVASHIKPYRVCDENEQFDKDNGLLLSKSIDQLFDQGWISFENDGDIILNENLDENLKKFLATKRIHPKILNEKRLQYLAYHRKYVFNNSKQYKF